MLFTLLLTTQILAFQTIEHERSWRTHDELRTSISALSESSDSVSLTTIGTSRNGQTIQSIRVSIDSEVNPENRPAILVVAGIDGDHLLGSEVAVELVLELLNRDDESTINLLKNNTVYIIPQVNPDAAEYYFAPIQNGQRRNLRPFDNDRDGLIDEDDVDDLNGDGYITLMRVRDQEKATRTVNPDNPRLDKKPDPLEGESAEFVLYTEGIDNDEDGEFNEDGIGGYDPNRNWPSDWQPEWIQYGATDYPFSLPETRVIGEFIYDHPNIAAAQSYHNAGGMILYGPNAKYISYPASDLRVFRAIAKKGGELLPFYDPMTVHEDLYTVHGGEDGFTYDALGIISFTNELWTDKRMMANGKNPSSNERKTFRDMLQFEDVFVPYHEVEHPQYGTILVGGTKKFSSRVTPPWMLEEGCHRNFAFTMFHADEMPKLKWGALQVKKLGNRLWEVTVEVTNDKLIPSRTAMAAKHRIGLPDVLICETSRANKVAASGTVRSLLPNAKLNAQETERPHRIIVNNGIGSNDSTLFQFVIDGSGSVTFQYAAEKGGTIERTVKLTEQFQPKSIDHKRAIPQDES